MTQENGIPHFFVTKEIEIEKDGEIHKYLCLADEEGHIHPPQTINQMLHEIR